MAKHKKHKKHIHKKLCINCEYLTQEPGLKNIYWCRENFFGLFSYKVLQDEQYYCKRFKQRIHPK